MTKVGKNVLGPNEGLVRQSVPGEDLVFKVTGDDTEGRLDYFALDILPDSGPPLHIHHKQHETIHFLTGRFRVHINGEEWTCEPGSFCHFPVGVVHAFLNVSSEPASCILTFTPGHTDEFFAEFGPIIRSFNGPPDPAVIGPIFAKHDWELVGPPLNMLDAPH